MRTLGITLAIVSGILFAIHGWIVFAHPQYFEGFAIDRPMHVAGGAIVALFTGLAIFTERPLSPLRQLPWWALALILISFTMLVGVMWELYEFGWDHFVADRIGAIRAQPNIQDTMEDFLFDLMGGGVASILFLWGVRSRPRV